MIAPPRRRVVWAVRLATAVFVVLAVVLGIRLHDLSTSSRQKISSAIGPLVVVAVLGPVAMTSFFGQVGRARRAASSYGWSRSQSVTRQLIRQHVPAAEDRGLALALADQARGTWWAPHFMFSGAVVFGFEMAIAADDFMLWLDAIMTVFLVVLTVWGERRRRRIVKGHLAVGDLPAPP